MTCRSSIFAATLFAASSLARANVIFLDFAGDPALDAPPSQMSATDQAIVAANVSSAFSMFPSVSVTTMDPGYDWDSQTLGVVPPSVRVLITPIATSYGGDAGLYGFIDSQPRAHTVAVFTQGMWPVTCAATHEIGHSLGLLHQSTWDHGVLVAEYNLGLPDESVGPWMGSAVNDRAGSWWVGLNDAGVMQDDVAIIQQTLTIPEPPMILIPLAAAWFVTQRRMRRHEGC